MKVFLLDIETRPNEVMSWGLYNQNISINQILRPGSTLCWAGKWLSDRKVHFRSSWNDGEGQMVRDAYEFMNEADAVVTYNGNKFDLPTLHKEFVLLGLTPPKPSYSIDLYRTVRKQFRFASNKLDFVCQQLGLGAKTQHKGMDLWRGVINDNPSDQRTMERYNKQDVVLLERLYHKLKPWVSSHPSVPLHNGDTERAACPCCGSLSVQSRGYRYTRTGVFSQFVCNDCGRWSRSRMADAIQGKRKELLV